MTDKRFSNIPDEKTAVKLHQELVYRYLVDFCAENGITSNIEIIPIQQINEAYERVLKRNVKYRFVIDLESLKQLD